MMHLKKFVYRLASLGMFGMGGRRTDRASKAVGIIMVHGIHDEVAAAGVAPPTSSVSMDAFKSNIRGLLGRFCFISLDEAVSMMTGRQESRARCVVLTFDDSLRSFANPIASLLSEWGVPATFFVSTEVIETQEPYWWLRLDYVISSATCPAVTIPFPDGTQRSISLDRRSPDFRELKTALRASSASECRRVVGLVEQQVGASLTDARREYPYAQVMTWDDVRRLGKLGMIIGSHTLTHPNLELLPATDLCRELQTSRQLIEEKAGVNCFHLCYPYGAHSDQVCNAARTAGYASGVTADAGWNYLGDDVFKLKRFAMPGEADKLSYILSGLGQKLEEWRQRSRALTN